MRMRKLTDGLLVGIAGALSIILLASCGGVTTETSRVTTGSATVTISDPPTCKAPIGDFTRVWVTVTRVRAHISSTADANDGEWVDLVEGLESNPMQIDLLNVAESTCTLATLGSASGLPPGNYQQIRLHLLSNNPENGVAVPATNNCGTHGFNCVELPVGENSEIHTLLLSSQDQTGIKIPPGRITGGAISIEAGQTADINIDFSACASVIRQGDGQFRLRPTLHAGEVSLAADSISGRAIDNSTGEPIPDATIFVMAEQPDTDGIDRVIMERLANSTTGAFSLCPLPSGNYDIVVAAVSEGGVTYNATITFGVPAGTAMGDVPLEPETGDDTSSAEIEGRVTTTVDGTTETGADIALSALQEAAPGDGSAMPVTIPLLTGSTTSLATEVLPTCPEGTKCNDYELFVPGSNPLVGTFTTLGTVYAGPAPGDVPYSVNAQAFVPGGEGTPNCSPSSVTTNQNDVGNPLTVTVGTPVTAQTLAFTACEAGH